MSRLFTRSNSRLRCRLRWFLWIKLVSWDYRRRIMLVGPQQAGVGKNSRPKQKLDIHGPLRDKTHRVSQLITPESSRSGFRKHFVCCFSSSLKI